MTRGPFRTPKFWFRFSFIIYLLLFTFCQEVPKDPKLKDLAESTFSISKEHNISLLAETEWIGSGFFLTKEGEAVTAAHLVPEFGTFLVRRGWDGKRYFARTIHRDTIFDIALIQIDTKEPLHVLPWAEREVEPGDSFWMVSAAYGLPDTWTIGRITAVHRLGIDPKLPQQDFYQTDSSIYPGSSGAALCNREGKVFGMAVFQWRRNKYQEPGLGFALPNSALRRYLDSVPSSRFSKSFLQWGIIEIPELTPYLSIKLSLGENRGILVSSVEVESPAEKAGIQRYDLLQKIFDKPIENQLSFQKILRDFVDKEEIEVEFFREGKTYRRSLRR